MRILLLSVNSRTFFYDQLVVPFGLSCLGSYVQDRGYTIKGIEMNSPPEMIPERYLKVDRQLLGEIVQYAPDLIAMSTYAENIHNVLFWAETIKGSLPETTILVGGNHASYIAEEILARCPAIDAVVRFEGEIPFEQICRKIENNDRDFHDVPSITYRRNGTIVENQTVGLIPDLNILPPLNRDFFESRRPSEINHADVITARGCPYHCTFCDCNHYWGKRYRTLSVARVVEELTLLKSKYPNLQTVRFRDESISINKKRCLQLCEALAGSNLGLKLQAHSRLDGLDEEVIRHLSMAGFNQLYIGLESGSQEVLDRIRKDIKISKVFEIVPLLRKYNVAFRFSLILGTPGETIEESLKTIQLVEDLDLSFNEFYFGMGLIIYPGTTDCETFLKKYPEYKWLRRNDLKGGYAEICDARGNPIFLRYHAARYDTATLNKGVNEKLGPRLLKVGETDYFDFRRAKDNVARIRHRFSEKGGAEDIVARFMHALDALGKKWAIYRDGVYCSELFPAVSQNAYKNFAGLYSPQDETGDPAAIRRALKTVKYLILAVSEEEAGRDETRNRIFGRWEFSGDALVLDQFLKNEDCAGQLRECGIREMAAAIRLTNGLPPRSKWYRRLVGKISRSLGIYETGKKIESRLSARLK